MAETKTKEGGRFSLGKQGSLVRFSASGYRPITKRVEDLGQDSEVTLKADPGGLWIPPQCQVLRGPRMLTGDTMQFNLVSGGKIRRGQDIDYQTNVVCHNRSCMQHGWGPLWSFGLPPWREFPSAFSNVEERDVQIRPNVEYKGNEYRGRRSDGTYMRFVGILGETISYDHATKDAAEYFDKVIDTLCWKSNGR